jgi:hypothetical protein
LKISQGAFIRENNFSLKTGRPSLDQVSEYLGIYKDVEKHSAANEIVNHAKDKLNWKKLVAAPKQPDR